ncbi:MAG: hypothetical protein DRI84_10140 [Bacteroidetes bacterium]|nr:MAG: hypothetical protein DRI84_10140 [Bacteroidota bacterium]
MEKEKILEAIGIVGDSITEIMNNDSLKKFRAYTKKEQVDYEAFEKIAANETLFEGFLFFYYHIVSVVKHYEEEEE